MRHGRFGYFAYYRNLPLPTGDVSLMWLLDPDVAYAFAQDDGITLLATFQTKDRESWFKRDLEANFEAYFRGLPNCPDLATGERISKILGKLDMPNTVRRAGRPGLAFVGDAAMSADPVWGIGCGWAFQSGEWLADALAPSFGNGSSPSDADLDAAIARYRKRHRSRLLGHFLMTSDYATGRRFNPMERMLFSAAARDDRVADGFVGIRQSVGQAERSRVRAHDGARAEDQRARRGQAAATATLGYARRGDADARLRGYERAGDRRSRDAGVVGRRSVLERGGRVRAREPRVPARLGRPAEPGGAVRARDRARHARLRARRAATELQLHGRGLCALPFLSARRARGRARAPRAPRFRWTLGSRVGDRQPGPVRERRPDQHRRAGRLPLALPGARSGGRRSPARRSRPPRRARGCGWRSATATLAAYRERSSTGCTTTSTPERPARCSASTERPTILARAGAGRPRRSRR